MPGDALKDSLYVPCSVSMLDDIDLNNCGLLAQLVYHRALLLAKRASTDGVVTWRQLAGHFYGLADAAELTAAIDELVGADLLADEGRDGVFEVTGWLKHNRPVEQIEASRTRRKARQREAAHVTNHHLGRHAVPVDECPECITPAQIGQPTVDRSVNRHGSTDGYEQRQASVTETETERETERKATDPQPVTQEGRHDPSAVAREMLRNAGYSRPRPTRGELNLVATALGNGYTPADLSALAATATNESVTNARAWLVPALTRMANDPKPEPAEMWTP